MYVCEYIYVCVNIHVCVYIYMHYIYIYIIYTSKQPIKETKEQTTYRVTVLLRETAFTVSLPLVDCYILQ